VCVEGMYRLGIGIDMNLSSTFNKILIDQLSTFWVINQLLIRQASYGLYYTLRGTLSDLM
jgi:hypothetical protein